MFACVVLEHEEIESSGLWSNFPRSSRLNENCNDTNCTINQQHVVPLPPSSTSGNGK